VDSVNVVLEDFMGNAFTDYKHRLHFKICACSLVEVRVGEHLQIQSISLMFRIMLEGYAALP